MADVPSLPTFARADAEAPWRPGAELLAESRLAHLLRTTGAPTLEALQARAVADPAWFWGVAVDDLGLDWQRPPTSVLDLADGAPFARWWTGGAFDHALASIEPWRRSRSGEEAVAWEGEDGEVRRLTGLGLAEAVEDAADRFAAHGIGEGARVGVLLPMLLETVVSVLALGRLRAVFTPIFSGYAAPAVATRLRAFEATHLVTADGFRRRGGVTELKAVADTAVAESPTVSAGARRAAGLGRGGQGGTGIPCGTRPGTLTRRPPSSPRCRPVLARPARPFPRLRTWSSTPRARPASRRAPSTSTAASRSRPPRTLPTRSTCAPGTPCAG
jgi:non-ribosomal peptide synthetase component F